MTGTFIFNTATLPVGVFFSFSKQQSSGCNTSTAEEQLPHPGLGCYLDFHSAVYASLAWAGESGNHQQSPSNLKSWKGFVHHQPKGILFGLFCLVTGIKINLIEKHFAQLSMHHQTGCCHETFKLHLYGKMRIWSVWGCFSDGWPACLIFLVSQWAISSPLMQLVV